ncbi:UDP-2,4-diacetamido-2,4,6-trideoxy-beta-L-altropyranose hydrolase [Oceanospirillaceae bacterium]|nr:UDP-2,4-diacetamido-2,4,6-trideoxy-beta-L-altropyranose hydrolase [Oceanospirillaceae bacterium]
MKNLVFRVDSGFNIGSGHLMRCLTLANNLNKSSKYKCTFITRNHCGNFNELINLNNFKIILPKISELNNKVNGFSEWLGTSQQIDAAQTLSALKENFIEKIDILVIDHYSLDIQWEKQFRDMSKKIVVVDDLANREHCCDMILDQNIAPNYAKRYDNLIPVNSKKYLGISYCLLREEFFIAKVTVKARSKLNNLVIFFGGVDKDNATLKLLNTLNEKLALFEVVNVIVGQSNSFKDQVKAFCQGYDNCYYLEKVSNMAEIFSQSDLAIGAGGATTWERIFLGLPSIVFSLADNQVEIAEYLNRKNYITFLGDQSEIETSEITLELDKYVNSPHLLREQSMKLLTVAESKLSLLIKDIALD